MDYDYHELANLFPIMRNSEYLELVSDIAENGLREPIVLFEDKILDGRNRFRACRDAEVTPDFRQYNGDDPIKYVVSLNIHRRHLDTTQRAMVAGKIADMKHGGDRKNQTVNLPLETTNQQAADLMNVSEKATRQARIVHEHGDQALIDETTQGNIKVSTAEVIADLPKEEQKEVIAKGKTEILAKAKEIKAERKKIRVEKKKDEYNRSVETAVDVIDKLWSITESQDIINCDVLITDPPYGILDEDWDNIDIEEFTCDWAKKWNDCNAKFIATFFAASKVFDGKKWFDDNLTNYDFQHLAIWHLPNNNQKHDRKGLRHTWEPIFIYRNKSCEELLKPNCADWNKESGYHDQDVHVSPVPQSNFNDENYKQHPAQKDINVMRWLVVCLSNPGELIVDPFMGSGTTGIASAQEGRRFTGIEINQDYLEIAKQRLITYGHIRKH